MIKPTVGRIVHFYPAGHEPMPKTPGEPLAAIVTCVWSDTCVNLGIFDANGGTWNKTSVLLVQDGEPKPEGGNYCTWMPYQLGQAAKTEALEKQLNETPDPAAEAALDPKN